MPSVTGSLSIKSDDVFYSLHFPNHGWMAADMIQYLEDVLAAEDPKLGILKLLGYTMQMNSEAPPRVAVHWVEVDLENRQLATNSELLRKAVRRLAPAEDEPYLELSLSKIYELLDAFDFSVQLYR